jgi:Domain of unknown function (DU1801)
MHRSSLNSPQPAATNRNQFATATTNKNPQTKILDMVNKEKKTLDEVLNGLDAKQKETTQNLRSLIKTVVPETTEIIRRGNITYTLDGKDFVWLIQAAGHVDLEFFMGSGLDSDLLRTRGIAEKRETVRHVEVRNFEKLQTELTRLLRDAARIGLEHCPRPTK